MLRKQVLIPALAVVLVGLTAFVLGGLFGSLPLVGVTGQGTEATVDTLDTPERERAEHPVPHALTGIWLVTNPLRLEDPPYLLTFAADGALTGASLHRDESITHGVWAATDERTATFTLFRLRTGETGRYAGTMMQEGSIEIDETGESFTGTYTQDMIIADRYQVPRGPFAIAGQRLAVLPHGTPSMLP